MDHLKHKIVLALIYFLVQVCFGQQKIIENKTDFLNYNYGKLRSAYTESHMISTELNDSITFYSNEIINKLKFKDFKDDLSKYRYYRTIISWYDRTKNDSLSFVLNRFKKENLPPIYLSHIYRILGTRYDHDNNVAAALEYFFKALEFSIEHNIESEIKSSRINLFYLLQSRFPDDPIWLEKKMDVLKKIIEIYNLKSLDIRKIHFIKETPFSIIEGKILDTSDYYINFKANKLYTNKKIKVIEKLSENFTENKDEINEEYQNLLKYYSNEHKNNNVYYNVLLSYIVFLNKNQDYQNAVNLSNRLNKILPDNIGYDYFIYSLYYENATLAAKNIKDYKTAFYYSQLNKKYENRNSINSQQAYDYLVTNINLKLQNKNTKDFAQSKQKNLFIVFVLIGSTLLILFWLIVKTIHAKKLSRINKELKGSRDKLLEVIDDKNNLETKLETLQSIISKDLHDNFGNKITGVINSYEIMKEINEKENLNSELFSKFSSNFEKSMTDLVTDIKDLIWLNNPKNNSLNDLTHRLINSKNSDINVSLNTKFNYNLELPKFWNRQIYLIFKEAIHNAYKHAKVNEVALHINLNKKGQLVIECINKGKGFDFTNTERKSGLSNMKKRANSINGEVAIFSKINEGTTIKFISEAGVFN